MRIWVAKTWPRRGEKMMHIQAEHMDEIQRRVLQHIVERGHRVQPRGTWLQEIPCASFQLLHPRARLIYSPSRKYSITFALGELLWYLRGSNNADIISFYNARHRAFSDDDITLHGAYGTRLFSPALTGVVQWDAVLSLLRADRDTRQAVLHLHLPSDLLALSRDIPCTCSIQFLLRRNMLECLVVMRSNDVIWGMPYDVFSFTMLQEIMAKQLGVEVGTYTHVIGSFHLYDRHKALAARILDETPALGPAMPELPEHPWQGIRELLETEEQLRLFGCAATWPTHPYWLELARIVEGHVAWRSKNELHLDRVLQTLCPQYATLLRQQVQRTSLIA